jgi:hypothetical protein
LALAVGQELRHGIALVLGGQQGGLEVREELLLLLDRHEFGGVREGSQALFQFVEGES